MHRLVPALVAEMGAAYPELVRAQPLIEATLAQEETRFRQTLTNGLKLLDEATAGMQASDTLAGETAFKLYDTFGFPYDLTEDALRAAGFGVDRAGFDTAMAEQKRAARAAWKGSGAKASDDVWFDIAEASGATEFTGYSADSGEGEVVALLRDGVRVDRAGAGDSVAVIVNQTPFYGESGGQVGDHARRLARSRGCRGRSRASPTPIRATSTANSVTCSTMARFSRTSRGSPSDRGVRPRTTPTARSTMGDETATRDTRVGTIRARSRVRPATT